MINTDKDRMQLINNKIGLFINNNNEIVDQDTLIPLLYKGKKLKVSNTINPRKEVSYNPVYDENMLRYLLFYYLQKLEVFNNQYYPINYPIYDKDGLGFALKNSEGKLTQSKLYPTMVEAIYDVLEQLD